MSVHGRIPIRVSPGRPPHGGPKRKGRKEENKGEERVFRLPPSVDVSTRAPFPELYAGRYGARLRTAFVAKKPTVAQPVKIDNDLYVRDYSKCILC